MPAHLSLISNVPAATRLTLIDGITPSPTWVVAGEVDWGNPTRQERYSGPRGSQGARPVQGPMDNRQVTIPIRVRSTSADGLAARVSELTTVIDEIATYGGRITRRAHGQTYRQHLEVLGASLTVPPWGKRVENTYLADLTIRAVCAPYALGDPMAWVQTFTADEDAETLEKATGTGTLRLNADGTLQVVGTVSDGPVILIDALRGYAYGDVRLDVYLERSHSLAADVTEGVVLRYVDADNWLAVLIEYDAGSGDGWLRVRECIAGTETVIGETAVNGSTVPGNQAWVSGWIAGSKVGGEWRLFSDPSPHGDHDAPSAEVAATLSTASRDALGATGTVGVMVHPIATGTTDEGITEVRCQPYYYPPAGRPEIGSIPLGGPIPGDAPALGAVTVTTGDAGTVPARWALLGWSPRRSGRNRVWNGSFDRGVTDGWSTGAVSGIGAAASALTYTDGISASGLGSALVEPGVSDTALVSFRIWDRFVAGRTYRATVWIRTNSFPEIDAELVLGVSGDLAVRTSEALPGVFTAWTVDWTPDADTDYAYVGVRQDGTTGSDFYLDAVSVVDLADEVTLTTQQEGRGGYPPLYLIPAVGHEQETGTSNATDADSAVGEIEAATASGAGSCALSYLVDPALTMADAYTLGELEVEVWARIEPDDDLIGLRATAWANPAEAGYDSDALGARRYISRFGSAGRPLTVPSTTDAWRIVRIGTVPLVIDPDNPGLARVTVEFSWTGGSNSLNVDWIALVPARSRALGPTGVDRSAGGYPDFIATADDEVAKTVMADLSAYVEAPPSRSRWADHGLGGSLIELPAGAVDLLVILSDLAPDDPEITDDSAVASIDAAIAVSPTPRWAHLRDA